jgi:hypothetical protein
MKAAIGRKIPARDSVSFAIRDRSSGVSPSATRGLTLMRPETVEGKLDSPKIRNQDIRSVDLQILGTKIVMIDAFLVEKLRGLNEASRCPL